MSKIIITADIHHGVPGRLQHTIWGCKVIKEYCKSANIDTILVLGDLFHNRNSIDIDVLQAVVDFHEGAAKCDQNWITFPGNHDMFLRHSWDINSISPLRKYLTVINDIKLLTLDDQRFWILPFITLEKSFMKVLGKIEYRAEEEDILLTHIGVRGATLNSCFLHKDWSVVNFDTSKFSKVYTGHFHSKQQLGEEGKTQIYYPGSLIPFKFDEGDVSHGFYVYDLKLKTHKFVNIWKAGKALLPNEPQPPQFCTFLDELLPEKKSEDVNNAIIRVALQREYTLEEKRTIKERLSAMGAVSVRWWQMNQKLEKSIEQILTTSQPSRNLFKAFIEADKKGINGLDLNILDKAHNDVMREGDELYAIEEAE